MATRAQQPAPTATRCARCNYPLPAPGPKTCPECGHTGHPVTLPRPVRSHRFTLGAALMIGAVALLPLLAAAASALLRL